MRNDNINAWCYSCDRYFDLLDGCKGRDGVGDGQKGRPDCFEPIATADGFLPNEFDPMTGAPVTEGAFDL